MRGLFIKDLCLIVKRWKVMLTFVAVAMFFGFTAADRGMFVIMYMTLAGALVAASTINYDEAGNGMAYLFTLPIDAKMYAIEKHVLIIAAAIISSVIGFICQIIVNAIQGTLSSMNEKIVTYVALLFAMIVIYSILVPLQFKFGAEKSRMIIGGGIGCLFGLTAWLVTALRNSAFAGRLYAMRYLTQGVIMAILLSGVIAVVLVCIYFSVKIMKNKEF